MFIFKNATFLLLISLIFPFIDFSLTWYGREVDDGRDHGAQANKDPESEEHGAPDRELLAEIAREP